MGQSIEDGRIHVDTEFNKHFKEVKYYEENKYGAIDILIHERGSDNNNVCAIECKKGDLIEDDLNKIQALLGPGFKYQYGATVQYLPKIIRFFQMINGKIEEEKIEL